MKRIARVLRSVAQWIDPQPITIEMMQVSPTEAPLNDLVGVPAYWWRVNQNTFSVYPAPEAEVRFATRHRMAASPVRLYAEDHPVLANKLRQQLEKARQEKFDQLSLAQDWPDFRERRGIIAGLKEAMDMCEQLEKQLTGDR